LIFAGTPANSTRMKSNAPTTSVESELATAPRKPLTPAAERALAEAAARRALRDKLAAPRPGEVRGAAGPDPVRYGDWEVKGIASDF
jgi:hypothetical protein